MIARHIETLFCDDIRREMGGKLSFMGIYSEGLLVPTFPVTLPKLCLFVKIVTPAEEPFRSLNLRVLRDAETMREIAFDEEQLAAISDSTEGMTEEQRQGRVHSAQATLIFSPLRFDEPCTLGVRVRTEGDELHGLALKVAQAQRLADSVSGQS